MKKGTKIALIVALIFALVGGGLCISALAMGVSYKDLQGIAEYGLFDFDHWWEQAGAEAIFVNDLIDETTLDDHHVDETHHSQEVATSNTMNYLVVDMDFGSLTVKSTDSSDISLDGGNDEKYFNLDVSENGITVSNRNESMWLNVDMAEAILYLPEDLNFEQVEIDIDAGGCTIEKELSAEQLYVDVDAGAATVEAMNVNWAEMDCDAGKITFAGSVFQGGSVDVDAGAVEIQLTGKEVRDYNYDVEVNAGSLSINEKDFSGLDTEQYINNGADFDWHLQCDVGKIEMSVNK